MFGVVVGLMEAVIPGGRADDEPFEGADEADPDYTHGYRDGVTAMRCIFLVSIFRPHGSKSKGPKGRDRPSSRFPRPTFLRATDEADDIDLSLSLELEPYKKGGGHHPLAKRALRDADNYDEFEALSIPDKLLKKLGIDHNDITGAQQTGYRAFLQTGAPLTYEIMEIIEVAALERVNIPRDVARATVRKARLDLVNKGVSGPVFIPWSGKKGAK